MRLHHASLQHVDKYVTVAADLPRHVVAGARRIIGLRPARCMHLQSSAQRTRRGTSDVRSSHLACMFDYIHFWCHLVSGYGMNRATKSSLTFHEWASCRTRVNKARRHLRKHCHSRAFGAYAQLTIISKSMI